MFIVLRSDLLESGEGLNPLGPVQFIGFQRGLRHWWLCVQLTFGQLGSGGAQTKGVPPRADGARRAAHKARGGGADRPTRRAAPGYTDHHGPREPFPASNPNKHENGSACSPAGPLSRPLAGQLQPKPPPPLYAWSPPPQSPSSPQLSPGSRLQHAWAHKAGQTPLLWGREDLTPGFCPNVERERGLRGATSLL